HRTIGRTIPQGWKYQVKNDLVLNYRINYEKKLLGWKNHFLLNGLGEAKVGTLNTYATTGANIMIGTFKNPYGSKSFHLTNGKKLTYYLFAQSGINFIGYDAALQGGLLNHKSVYTIPANEVERITFQQTAGFAFNISKVYISYFKSALTKEFRTGKRHMWGGIRIGVAL
ncbi:MAG TPA: lipid A-modifier LpxR family protein, partial [Chitinophagaceae bacterium]|nr:lipid A-modifier LpxR family protein [Chitinophagaceae bacterium]